MSNESSAHVSDGSLETKETKLIRDTPASLDSFGAHGRVASAISNMINTEDGGIAISLEGTWGSGKSTVVNLLDKQTTEQLFIFDAWSHEGDPLRRVFIESLIEYCLPKMASENVDKWAEIKNELTKKVRTIETNTTPKSPISTALAIGYAAGLPIAVLLLGLAVKSGSALAWWEWIMCAYVLTPLPYCLYTAANLYRIKSKHNHSRFTDKQLGFFDFFQHKSSQIVTNNSVETVDTTSIEFQTYFTRLMDDYLGGADERQIVIVLDNLDRLPESSALSLWSTLRVFMECWESRDKYNWANRSWLLVPYDRTAVRHLWKNQDIGSTDGTSAGAKESIPGTPAAFLDKTFQIRYEIPPLISADWKEYLLSLLKQAFPDHDKIDEQHKTYRISALLAEEKGRPPTPRHMKLFVNDIGALRRQFHDRFPLHHLAYYAILKRQGESIRFGLLNGTIPEDKYKYILGEDVVDSLAAVCFNTLEVSHALDLLLAPSIHGALKAGDTQKLNSLAMRRGFWDVAETAIVDAPTLWHGDQAIASIAMSTLLASDIATLQTTAAISTIPQFIDSIMDNTQWESLDENVAKGMSDSMYLLDNERHSNRICQVISNIEIPDVAKTVAEIPESIKEWVGNLVNVLKTCIKLERTSSVKRLSTGASNRSLICVYAELSRHPELKEVWRNIAPVVVNGQLMIEIYPAVSQPYWTDLEADAVKFLADSGVKAPWSGLIDAIKSALGSAEHIPSELVGRMIDTLKSVRVKNASEKVCNYLATEGYLFHHLYRCRDKSEHKTAARIVYEIAMHTNPTSAPKTVGDSLAGHKWLGEIISTPQEYKYLISELMKIGPVDTGDGFLSKMLNCGESTDKFVAMCYSELIDADEVPSRTSSAHLRKNWKAIRRAVDVSDNCGYEDIISAYIGGTDLVEQLQAGNLDLQEVDLHDDLVRYELDVPQEYIEWLINQLTEVDVGEWVSSVHDSDTRSLLEILSSLHNKKQECKMGSNFQTALVDLANEIISGKWNGGIGDDHWDAMVKSIPEASLVVLGKKVLDNINVANIEFSREIYFKRYGNIIASVSKCSDQENVVRLVFLPIIEEESVAGSQWIAEQLGEAECMGTYNKSDIEDREHFKLVVTEKMKQDDDVFKPVICKIAQLLNIELPIVGSDTNGNGEQLGDGK
jgi:hypothetical protein